MRSPVKIGNGFSRHIPYLMACLEIHANNPERATDWFYKAISPEKARGHPTPPNGGNIPEAFTGALFFASRPVYTCRQLSPILHARGEFQLAVLALKAWLAYTPTDPHALELLGDVADLTGNHKLASNALAQIHSLGPCRIPDAVETGKVFGCQRESAPVPGYL